MTAEQRGGSGRAQSTVPLVGRQEPNAGVSGQDVPGNTFAPIRRLDSAWILAVPYPPTTNNLYMTINGRRVKTPAARDYADSVFVRASIVRERDGVPSPPYRLTIHLWMPDHRRRDLDNGVKALQDALLKATGHDDARVEELHVYKSGVDRKYPHAVVTLESLQAIAPQLVGEDA